VNLWKDFVRTMFTLNLIALASEVEGLYPSSVGWMVIAVAWSIIGALWLAGSFLSAQRALQSSGVVSDRECPEARNT
jgi:hypothetical protein